MSKITFTDRNDTNSYKGWLNSDSFIQRCFAVVGYYMVGALIIYGVILAIAVIFAFFIGMASGL